MTFKKINLYILFKYCLVKDENVRRMLREMEYLSEDVSTLTQMTDMVSMLHCPHSQLEDSIKDMLSALNKQLLERQASDTQLCYLELNLHTRYTKLV